MVVGLHTLSVATQKPERCLLSLVLRSIRALLVANALKTFLMYIAIAFLSSPSRSNFSSSYVCSTAWSVLRWATFSSTLRKLLWLCSFSNRTSLVFSRCREVSSLLERTISCTRRFWRFFALLSKALTSPKVAFCVRYEHSMARSLNLLEYTSIVPIFSISPAS